ncbi:hypothetical protein MLD38_039411 [Melastoma candidum]|uniref:Uncharacterized protein n=1 Tax=Melastoma candidum TaxID=119954 RepID=A0ACB9L2B0_9MYRT|nr:hypothetical protein MLD38_039411 [Melastoma candidum]
MQFLRGSARSLLWQTSRIAQSTNSPTSWASLFAGDGACSAVLPHGSPWFDLGASLFPCRGITTQGNPVNTPLSDASLNPPARIKFKRLDKTARHIMNILDKEAVDEVRSQREIPDIRPGYIVQLKVEVPENKRRVQVLKGIVIARRNAGLNSTFRIRRQVAGVGVENLFPLYSPNIKEIKVLDKKKVRRAKLYYLREKMNALKKH